jgi:predicted DCC family thiol-disulfide oxidoreductase YuxK
VGALLTAPGRALAAVLRAFDRALFAEVDARPFAALRIAVGALAFLTFFGLYPVVEFFHSDAGWLPADRALAFGQSWSLLYVFTSPLAVRLFALGAMAAALALALGWRSRLASVATFVALVSFQQRDPLINYGGDTVIKLLAFGIMLGPSGRAWSIDALFRRRRLLGEAADRGERDLARLRRRLLRPGTVPAWPLRLIQFQVCVLYFMTGLAKLHGSSWHDGSALALALANPQLSRYDMSAVAPNAAARLVFEALTVAVLVWELFFAALVFLPVGRWIALGTGIFVHLGIVALMRVHWFGHIMIASYLAFVPAATLRRFALCARRRLRARLGRRRTWVIYEGDCPACRRAAGTVALLDVLRAVRLAPASEAYRARGAAPRLSPGREVREGPIVVPPGGAPLSGFDGLAALGRTVPALSPLWLLAFVPGARALGRAVAREIAASHRDAHAEGRATAPRGKAAARADTAEEAEKS